MRLSLMAAVLVLSACRPPVEQLIDLNKPPPGTERVRSVESIQDRFSYRIVTPSGLRGSEGIYARPESDDGVWFVFDDPRFGRLWIVESLPDMPDARERMAGYRDASDHGDLIRVRDGAWLFVGPGRGEFVERGVQFQVLGLSLTQEEVVRIVGLI